jgi:hypothetical protein
MEKHRTEKEGEREKERNNTKSLVLLKNCRN